MIAVIFLLLLIHTMVFLYRSREAQDTLTRIEKLLKELKEKEKE